MAERAVGSAALVLVDGATPVRPEPVLFEVMLEGWRRQQTSRRLSSCLIGGRERLVRSTVGIECGTQRRRFDPLLGRCCTHVF